MNTADIGNLFQAFCDNLRMPQTVVDSISKRYHAITHRINIDYWNSDSYSNHSLYVGSYGRGTKVRASDVDMLVQLPNEVYEKFNDYSGNGQSSLLQEVKGVLQKTYSTSKLRGDGQVIGVTFTDGSCFEIVPSFLCDDGSYIYPDSNNGGRWRTTNPKAEIDAINKENNASNKNLKRLCRMARAWREICKVDISGILIDTLAYKFIKNWEYKNKSYMFYDWLSRDFFKYLMNLNPNQDSWTAPGSNRHADKNSIAFINKAKYAYNAAVEAIDSLEKGHEYSAKQKWRSIYGTKFPE